jgi:hypothetical protein
VLSLTTLTVEATSVAGAKVYYPSGIATDAVGVTSLTFSKLSGSQFALGTTLVTVTAKDAAGNTVTGTLTVIVHDTTGPTISSVSANLTIEATSAAGAIVSYAAAVASDATGTPTISYSKPSGSTFAIGTTIVTVTATDGWGNVSTRTFTITVRDTTAPVFTSAPPSVITVNATSAAGAIVTYAPAIATDAVGPVTITYSKLSGTQFALGFTQVTITATDGAGNVSAKTFWVWVR